MYIIILLLLLLLLLLLYIYSILYYIIHLSLGKLMTIHFHREFSIVIILYTYTIMNSNYGMDDPTHKT